MLIELGPTQLVRGRDWHVYVNAGGVRSVYISFAFFQQHVRYGIPVRREPINAAARSHGFDVTDEGVVTNWDAVPHLWEV